MMMNYMTNKLLNAGATFDAEDPKVFKPGKNSGQIINDELLVSEYSKKFGVNNTHRFTLKHIANCSF